MIKSRLWLQLSLLLGGELAAIVGCSYSLVVYGIVPTRTAFELCFTASTFATMVVLWSRLNSLRLLADAAVAMQEGQPLIVKSTSSDDVGRIAQALRSLQLSTQAAMSRLSRPPDAADPFAHAETTGAWPVVRVGAPAWVTRVAFAMAGCGFVAFVMIFVTREPKPTTETVALNRSVETPRVAPDNPSTTSARGVTKDSITLGMSAPFSGGPRALSDGMKLGLDAAFAEVNAAGGVNGRQLKLIALDNGYDEKRALETTRELIEKRAVFGLVGSVGTPTVKAVLPYVNQGKVLLFGPLTGSPVTRPDPPDRYVFNVRASYAAETTAMVNYLLDVKKIPGRGIVVFAQNDSYGDAGYEGVKVSMRKHGFSEPLRMGYERNSTDVGDAAARVLAYSASIQKSGGVRAVVVVATATASASFTSKISSLNAVVLNVSFVDASQLALEFKDHWPGVGTGVIVTQVVPHFESGATGVIHYREALKAYFPDKTPGFASLEGYEVGELLAEGLRRAGPDPTTERVVDALEKIQGLDLGTGGAFNFGVSNHQASQRVWGTVLTTAGTFKPLDAEWTE